MTKRQGRTWNASTSHNARFFWSVAPLRAHSSHDRALCGHVRSPIARARGSGAGRITPTLSPSEVGLIARDIGGRRARGSHCRWLRVLLGAHWRPKNRASRHARHLPIAVEQHLPRSLLGESMLHFHYPSNEQTHTCR